MWSDYEGRRDRAPVLQDVGAILLVAGLAAAGTGIVLLVLGGQQNDTPRAHVALGPGTLQLRGTF